MTSPAHMIATTAVMIPNQSSFFLLTTLIIEKKARGGKSTGQLQRSSEEKISLLFYKIFTAKIKLDEFERS